MRDELLIITPTGFHFYQSVEKFRLHCRRGIHNVKEGTVCQVAWGDFYGIFEV